jgi:hypothetical protein
MSNINFVPDDYVQSNESRRESDVSGPVLRRHGRSGSL